MPQGKGYRLIEAFEDFTLYYDEENKNLVVRIDNGKEKAIALEDVFGWAALAEQK